LNVFCALAVSDLASYEQLMATGFLAYNLCGQGPVHEARQLAEGALWSCIGSPDTYEAYVCRSVPADDPKNMRAKFGKFV